MILRHGTMHHIRRHDRGLARALWLVWLAGATSAALAQDVRPPAPTLSCPTTPAKAADADGFLRRWLVLEPIRATPSLTDSDFCARFLDGNHRPITTVAVALPTNR